MAMLGDQPWFNVPSSLNWDWFNIDRRGWWCWEDLWHAGNPVWMPFDWSRFYWGCGGDGIYIEDCPRVWTVDEMARLEPGCPTSAPQCDSCGSPHAWPRPKELPRD